jgi:polyisoprenoid-binding protein YceI
VGREGGRFVRALAAALAFGAPAALAAPEAFTVDPGHTFPAFEVVHLGISTQRGRFDRTSGRIEIDREAGTGRIELAIETASVSTGNKALDGVLKGEDFFDVEKHPRMTFRANRVEFDKGEPRRAQGELTMNGVTRPVALTVDRFACTRLPFLVRLTCGADVTATLKRGEFGMSRFSNFVADEVRIVVQVEAVREEPATAPPASGG